MKGSTDMKIKRIAMSMLHIAMCVVIMSTIAYAAMDIEGVISNGQKIVLNACSMLVIGIVAVVAVKMYAKQASALQIIITIAVGGGLAYLISQPEVLINLMGNTIQGALK